MNVAIIGCGLIGEKRLAALGDARAVVVFDLERERAERLAAKSRTARVAATWEDAATAPDVDAVLVATTNNWLAPIATTAAGAGKHVLVEKPGAISVGELDAVAAAAEKTGVVVHVGFNHRFHPALQHARALVDEGAIGELMFIRGRYGHGGRVGYDREWRANPEISGGGELIDQGVHLIDLSRWFLGDFCAIDGFATTYFWDMPVDDNAFLSLRTANGTTAWLHVSCSEWKNLFSLEIYGRGGKLHLEGLGGSYGVERIAFYKMLPQMGPPETTIWEYPGADVSWAAEFKSFANAVAGGTPAEAGILDARRALEIVSEVYAKGAQR